MSLVLKALPIITVATHGTAVAFSATSIPNVVEVYISCPSSNTGNIQVGDSAVESQSSLQGVEIAKGASLVIRGGGQGGYIDLQNMYADAYTSGDKVLVSYLQRV